MILWGIIIGFLCLFQLSVLAYRKQLRRKDERIDELRQALESLQENTDRSESRKALRVKFEDQACTFEMITSADPVLEKLKNKKAQGMIREISMRGLTLSSPLDLPIQKRIYVIVDFTLHTEDFLLSGLIVRKEETFREYTYEMKFSGIEKSKDRHRLFRILNHIELTRSKGIPLD